MSSVRKEQLPAFVEDQYPPVKMRQLAAILERRLSALENTATSADLTDAQLATLDALYAPIAHTHTKSEITDFGSPLYDLSGSSIGDLSDVDITGIVAGQVPTWDGTKFVPQTPTTASSGSYAALSDTDVGMVYQDDVALWNASTSRWTPVRKTATPWLYRGGDVLSGDLRFNDNVAVVLSTAELSRIFHDGTDAYWDFGSAGVDAGSAYLYVRAYVSGSPVDALRLVPSTKELDVYGRLAVGSGADVATLPGGLLAIANGQTALQGDAQALQAVLRLVTTDATPSVLTTDGAAASGSSNVLAIPVNSTWLVRLHVIGRDVATQDSYAARFSGMLDIGATAATLTAAGFMREIFGQDQAWSVAVTADTTNGALVVTVTGETAKTIRWVAHAELVQVSF